MSVLIYDMNMPESGEFSHIRIYGDGDVTVEVSGKEHIIGKAISVPTPHGRLIDASEKIKVQIYDEQYEDYHLEEMTIDDLLSCGWVEADGQTIIEAEDGE